MSTRLCSVILISTLLLGFFTIPGHAAEVKLVGEVNDVYQLVTDDQIYEIGDNEMGDTLVYDHIGDKVEVTGTLDEVDDMKVLTVKNFKVLSE